MESSLTPRDIQARIRAGESVEDVAAAAGVTVERIDAFAAPVVAERDHVAGLAQAGAVRRRGESSSNRPLRAAVAEQFLGAGLDPDGIEWDAALIGARRWRVTATFQRDEQPVEAHFVYDVNGRFSVADDDDARWMIGDGARAPEAAPAATDNSDDDELALVRAIQDDDEGASEVNDAYTETELTEVDGVYDIVGGDDSDMDALYDMLASFDEDSVKIYAGLIHPEAGPLADPAGAPSADTPPLPEGARVEPLYVPEDVAARQAARPAEPPVEAEEPEPADSTGSASDGSLTPSKGSADDPAPADQVEASPQPEASPPAQKPITEPEQPTLVGDEPAPAAPRRTPKRKPRASVPSWDEIMFGSPRQGPDTR